MMMEGEPQTVSGSTLSCASSSSRIPRINKRVPSKPKRGNSDTWNSFLSAYQQGHWKRSSDEAATESAHLAATEGAKSVGTELPEQHHATQNQACSRRSRKVHLDDGNSIDNHAFFEKFDYMAAPPLPEEKRRLRSEVLFSHGFTKDGERSSVAAYVRHARKVFRCNFAAVSVACSDEKSHLILAKEGDVCKRTLSTLKAMSGHAMLLDNDEVFVVSDITHDWRFSQLVKNHDDESHAMLFFASAPILLSVASDGEQGGKRIHVGRLTIMRRDAWPEFDEEDAQILMDIASMTQEALENEYLHQHAKKVRNMQKESASLSYRLNRTSDTYRDMPDSQLHSKLGILARPEQMRIMTESLLKFVKPSCVSAFDVSCFRSVSRTLFSPPLLNPFRPQRSASPATSPSASRETEEGIDPFSRVSVSESNAQPSSDTANLEKDPDFEIDSGAEPSLIAQSGESEDAPMIAGSAQKRALAMFFSFVAQNKLYAKPQWFASAEEEGFSDEEEEALVRSKNVLSPLFSKASQLSCAIPVFTSDRSRPLLLFLLSWRDRCSLDEADKLFCYTVGVVAAATTFRQQAGLAETTQLDFIRSMQHELRTPLNGILGITDFLRTNLITTGQKEKLDTSDDSVLVHLLESLRLSGVTLSSALDDVLDFGSNTGLQSRRGLGLLTKVNLSTEITNVCKGEFEIASLQARQSVALNAQAAPNTGVPYLIMDIDKEIQRYSYRVDREKLEKIVGKFISNALRFTAKDGLVHVIVKPGDPSRISRRASSISHAVQESIGWVDFIIQDEGMGMSETFLAESFLTPFSKENSFSPGLGLGVTIAASLIENLGGQLEVQSEQDKGTIVRISLPIERIVHFTSSSDSNEICATSFRKDQNLNAFIVGFDNASQGVLKEMLLAEFGNANARLSMTDADIDILMLHEDVIAKKGEELDFANQTLHKMLRPHAKILVVSRDLARASQVRNIAGFSSFFIHPPYSRDGFAEAVRFAQEDHEESTDSKISNTPSTDAPSAPSISACSSALSGPESSPYSSDSKFSLAKLQTLSVDAGGERAELERGVSFSSTMRHSDASLSSAAPSSHSEALSDILSPLKRPEDLDATALSHKDIWLSESMARHPTPDEEKGLRDFRVLVVEDNPVNMKLITSVLSRAGILHAEAKDGLEAISQYRAFRPSVVLLDISLPHMDGFEACIKMRECKFLHTPRIVAVTALSSNEDRLRGLRVCGMDDWWTKPLNIRALRADVGIFKADWEAAWRIG